MLRSNVIRKNNKSLTVCKYIYAVYANSNAEFIKKKPNDACVSGFITYDNFYRFHRQVDNVHSRVQLRTALKGFNVVYNLVA